MNWIYLILAGIFEIGFTTALKLSHNFTNWKWSIAFLLFSFLSFSLLSRAMQVIPLGTAYAIWTGIGAVGTVIIGMVFFKEPADFWRVFFITLLLISIVGLKVSSN